MTMSRNFSWLSERSTQSLPNRNLDRDRDGDRTPSWALFAKKSRRGKDPSRGRSPQKVRQTVAAYNLDWNQLREFLQQEFPRESFTEKNLTVMQDKYILYLPEALKDDQRQEIDVMRSNGLQRSQSHEGVPARSQRDNAPQMEAGQTHQEAGVTASMHSI